MLARDLLLKSIVAQNFGCSRLSKVEYGGNETKGLST